MVDINLLKNDGLLYVLKAAEHSTKNIIEILKKHNEVKFVSLMGLDLRGNATDEKIPIRLFIDDIENFLKHGVQTDGSSVELEKIATINDGKVVLIPDLDCDWIVDYNFSFLDEETGKPVGTLKIPAFIMHSGKYVCSRSVLKRACGELETYLKAKINGNECLKDELGIEGNIKEIQITAATELEFWVKTPQEISDEEELSTSQGLKEQYWKRTEGNVRTSLEYILLLMEKMGFEPEMAHKEVGGIHSKLKENGDHFHIMEQLEIDWKYSSPMINNDRVKFIKYMISDIFNHFGLEVTFDAKPVEGVAGSGEHMHIGVGGILDDGTKINLFNQTDHKATYLSSIGYASLLGILKNFKIINPFITNSTDAFNRLTPGFEAPVCTVCSIGKAPDMPSRNRSVLMCLIKDRNNPFQTRFEMRAANPTTNTYLAFAAVYQCMIDGMEHYLCKYSPDEILKDLSKKKGEPSDYLEADREYRSEEDVFEKYSHRQREALYSKAPATVYENIMELHQSNDKFNILKKNDVFTRQIIDSYIASSIDLWAKELKNRIIEKNRDIIRSMVKLHGTEYVSDLDIVNWSKIDSLKWELMKDTTDKKSVFSKIIDNINKKNYNEVSRLQLNMTEKLNRLRELYSNYKKNII